MRAVLQRVREASVSWDGGRSSIGPGLLILVAVARGDGPEDARWLASKCAALRIFDDEHGRMDRSLLDVGGSALVVSQFTLHADCRKGRRPSYERAAAPLQAEPLYASFASHLRALVSGVEEGAFGARMAVSLVNDGPVTLVVDTP